MAKLNARGRTKVAQISKITPLMGTDHDCKVKHERVLMSYGVVLKKVNFLKPNGTIDHGTGWSVSARTKPGVDVREFAPRWVAANVANGWQEVTI